MAQTTGATRQLQNANHFFLPVRLTQYRSSDGWRHIGCWWLTVSAFVTTVTPSSSPCDASTVPLFTPLSYRLFLRLLPQLALRVFTFTTTSISYIMNGVSGSKSAYHRSHGFTQWKLCIALFIKFPQSIPPRFLFSSQIADTSHMQQKPSL